MDRKGQGMLYDQTKAMYEYFGTWNMKMEM